MSAASLIALTAPVGPEGAPLVVLGPSLGTSTTLWDDVVPLLADDYRVAAWDLPGHGAGPVARDAFTVADLSDAVARAVPCLLYTSPSPRDRNRNRMPSSA